MNRSVPEGFFYFGGKKQKKKIVALDPRQGKVFMFKTLLYINRGEIFRITHIPSFIFLKSNNYNK